ncbi:NADPH2 dehydrogenase [Pelagirhabdus alkalitolerans]|uniref:NADPH2 dehydrogenase n=1 Tax=Pelagirhabdus alkalitolerans TaxID=1612202 RepID=A0A1G6HC16_9BACI|nr:NADPH dehydrogenase NamA [Pelagirhabdus alkalitolerans]SDB91847.1 NADPH2 dehydrogenase [Pelagirhabdus alkalitolerans]
MNNELFQPIQFKQLVAKNKLVMSPMCTYQSLEEDGMVTPFHLTHYESRAIGQIGTIMIEATAVQPEGRISTKDLGIWSDDHIGGLQQLNQRIHAHGALSAIQLGHAGKKAKTNEPAMTPTEKLDDKAHHAKEMTLHDIEETIHAFKQSAIRSINAGFDIIEIHGAHGYLVNQFLSPLTNQREDEYGGSRDNRYRLLKEIIDEVKSVFDGPLFVRISADEYHQDGNQLDDFIYFANQMKQQGVDLIDVSTGGVIQAAIDVFPGYQVKHAETIKHQAQIKTGTVGLITQPQQAEEIIHNERADLVFLGRVLLRDPYWALHAARSLNVDIALPEPYKRGW